MKLKFFFTLVVSLLLLGSANAQTKNFAYADLDSVIKALPEFETKMKEFEIYQKQLMTSLKSQEEELQKKYIDFQNNQANWLPEIVNQKKQELEILNESLNKFRQSSQVNLSKRQQEVLLPLQEKAMKGIEEVAKSLGYQYVIPTQMLLYNDGKDDITDKVIAKLK